THSDWQRFDEIFAAYWLGRGMRHAVTLRGTPSKRGTSLTRQAPGDMSLNAAEAATRVQSDQAASASPRGTGRREGASATELLSSTDLRHIIDPDDIAQAHALAARLARAMRARLIRREQVRRRGRRLDLRRTIHRSVAHGGTPVELAWRQRKIKPLRLVVL